MNQIGVEKNDGAKRTWGVIFHTGGLKKKGNNNREKTTPPAARRGKKKKRENNKHMCFFFPRFAARLSRAEKKKSEALRVARALAHAGGVAGGGPALAGQPSESNGGGFGREASGGTLPPVC